MDAICRGFRLGEMSLNIKFKWPWTPRSADLLTSWIRVLFNLDSISSSIPLKIFSSIIFGVAEAVSGVVKNLADILRIANSRSEFLLLFAMKSLPFLPRIDNELDDMLGGGVEVATEMDESRKER
jgi:hypothetical protein